MWGTVAFKFRVGSNGPVATLSRSVISGSSRVSVDGRDISRAPTGERAFVVPLEGGGRANIVVRGRGYDYVPQVFVDGNEIPVARALATWEYALAALPLLLLFVGGIIGAIVGFAAMAANQWLLRSVMPRLFAVAATLGVGAFAFVAVEFLVAAARVLATRSP